MKLTKIFFLFLFISISTAQELGPVPIVIGSYPPFIDQTVDNEGIMTELVKKAFDSQGVDYDITYTNWTKVEESVNDQSAISFAYLKNTKRLKTWYYSIPIIQAPVIFIKNSNSDIELREIEDLKKFKIGVTSDYSYGETFDKLRPMLQLEEVGSDLLNMKKVFHQRIDLFPLPLYNAIYYMRENFSKEDRDQFEFVFYPALTKGDLHLVCHKSRPDCIQIIKAFNKGLSSVVEKGIKDRIISTYLTWK